jgi:Cu-processing system ATP-binding protein
MVPEHEKLAVLKQLLSLEGLDDIHIESANLEQVYQHFLEKHEQQLPQQTQGGQK